MKITFISCFLNHHQISLCKELASRCDEFYFVATAPIPQSRLNFGYEDLNTKYDFVLRTYDNSCTKVRLYELLAESDVVIFGTSPAAYIEYRMRQNKLSFLYSERFFKKGTWRRFVPFIRKKVMNRIVRFNNQEMYVLCASAFLSWELSKLGFDENKCFKWGYFPKTKAYDSIPERKNTPVKLLWAGRMISWKHAEHVIKAAAKLKRKGLDFTLDLCGSGENEEELRALCRKLKLQDRVSFLGSMSPDIVLEHMEQADVYLMTSDFREGWGAVVNEAMSTGCAVLASSAAGSTPFIIKDGENGLIYKYGCQRDLERKLRMLVEDRQLRQKLGAGAYDTIRDRYNAEVAAHRLVEFVKAEDKSNFSYEEGPMSKAYVMRNNWYKI